MLVSGLRVSRTHRTNSLLQSKLESRVGLLRRSEARRSTNSRGSAKFMAYRSRKTSTKNLSAISISKNAMERTLTLTSTGFLASTCPASGTGELIDRKKGSIYINCRELPKNLLNKWPLKNAQPCTITASPWIRWTSKHALMSIQFAQEFFNKIPVCIKAWKAGMSHLNANSQIRPSKNTSVEPCGKYRSGLNKWLRYIVDPKSFPYIHRVSINNCDALPFNFKHPHTSKEKPVEFFPPNTNI